MLPIPVPPHFRNIAHRGASAYAPENTHAAFALAQRMGVTEIELDTQLTTDGQIALIHDGNLGRYGYGTQGGHGARAETAIVEEMNWPDLAALDMGSWFSPFLFGGERAITLDDLFAAYGDAFVYHVEIKGKAPALPAAVHKCIMRHARRDQCVITSFSYTALVAMREIDPTLRLGWLVRPIDEETVAKARALDLFQLCPFAPTVTREQVALARQVVPEVRAWGVSGETVGNQGHEIIALIEQLLAAGCDGMTINWPDWVRSSPL